jgi:hypothetical protein
VHLFVFIVWVAGGANNSLLVPAVALTQASRQELTFEQSSMYAWLMWVVGCNLAGVQCVLGSALRSCNFDV